MAAAVACLLLSVVAYCLPGAWAKVDWRRKKGWRRRRE